MSAAPLICSWETTGNKTHDVKSNIPDGYGAKHSVDHSPVAQAWAFFRNGNWEDARTIVSQTTHNLAFRRVRVLTWNIDFQFEFAKERMSAALRHLQQVTNSGWNGAQSSTNDPIVIMLQEITRSDLNQIKDTPWIQDQFYLSDMSIPGSPGYSTLTLIDRRLQIKDVFRVKWCSAFDRDGLFVDIRLPSESVAEAAFDGSVLRLCNLHLESLVADPPVRPLQMEQTAKYLQHPDIYVGIAAGDCNAIQSFDRTLPEKHGLRDAFLVLGGQEDSDEGFTWGFQSPRDDRHFPRSRMDKVLFCGQVNVKELRRIGVAVKVSDGEIRRRMEERYDSAYVTDHYGLEAVFQILDKT